MTGPVQWPAAVLARRRSGSYTVLTVSAPGVADRCRPGHYVSLSVAAPDSAMLLRRQAWIATSSASGRDGGALELVLDGDDAGCERLNATPVGATLDAIGPLGRPFSLPREPVGVLFVASGAPAAPLIWLASLVGARGCRSQFVYVGDQEPFGLLEARRVSSAATVAEQGGSGAVTAHLSGDVAVLYSGGTPDRVRRIVAAVGATRPGLPHQTLVGTGRVCAAATCTACVVPVRGRDQVTRMVRACQEGPVFNADLVRWEDWGRIPADCPGAGIGAPA